MLEKPGSGGVWIRIQHRFGPRQMEWFMAGIVAAMGLVLLLPAETYDNGPSWGLFRAAIPEVYLGLILFVAGVARITGLIINGSRREITPWIRVGSASVGFLIWIGITTGFFLGGEIGTWLAIYPSFAVAEIINIVRSARDAGENYAT